jgi:hypothetical protein
MLLTTMGRGEGSNTHPMTTLLMKMILIKINLNDFPIIKLSIIVK